MATLAVGHQPGTQLKPQDAALFRAFQSNLLSLISHELRTPLISILNTLTVLDEGEMPPGVSSAEWIKMARQNAQKLQGVLASLLDLAELESGTFHARLREIDWVRLVRQSVELARKLFQDRGIEVVEDFGQDEILILGDPQKLARALELCLEMIASRASVSRPLKIRISSSHLKLRFELQEGALAGWDEAWSHALVAFQGGVGSPASVFGGVLRSEQAFLSRMEEGLGSEWLLIHEIIRLHHGRFEAVRNGLEVILSLELMPLSAEEHLKAVLLSRAFGVSSGLSSVVLILIRVPEGTQISEFREKLKASLFRTSDAVYAPPFPGVLALVMDDIQPSHVSSILERLQRTLGGGLTLGFAHCPEDVLDPSLMIGRALSRLNEGATLSRPEAAPFSGVEGAPQGG